MSIQAVCPGCARQYDVAEQYAGKQMRCQACQSVVTVPDPSSLLVPLDEMPGVPTPLQIADDDPLGVAGVDTLGGTPCPNCGSTMQPGAVLCIDCGYHTQRGTQVGREKKKRKKKRKSRGGLPISPMILLYVGGGALFVLAFLCLIFPPSVIFGGIGGLLISIGTMGVMISLAWIFLVMLVNDPVKTLAILFFLPLGWLIIPSLDFDHEQLQSPATLIKWSILVVGTAFPFFGLAALFS